MPKRSTEWQSAILESVPRYLRKIFFLLFFRKKALNRISIRECYHGILLFSAVWWWWKRNSWGTQRFNSGICCFFVHSTHLTLVFARDYWKFLWFRSRLWHTIHESSRVSIFFLIPSWKKYIVYHFVPN